MKKLSKVLVLVLSAIMVLAMSASVFAAEGDVVVTIDPKTPENVTVNAPTYTYYVMLKASVGENGTSYFVEKEDLATALDGLKVGDDDLFTVTKAPGANRWTVVLNEAYKEKGKEVADALYTIKDKAIATGEAENNKITLAYDAYLLVESSLGTKLVADTVTTKTIEEKNTYPTVKKEGDQALAGIGDTVTYTLEVAIPESVASKDIKIVDTITDGLTLNTTATVAGAAAEPAYTTATFTGGENGVYTITIPAATVIANKGKTLTFTYTAVVNEKAKVLEPETNKAHLEYDNYTSVDTETVSTKTLAFTLEKVDGKTKAELTGAQFSLWTAAEDGTQINLVKDGDAYRVATAEEASAEGFKSAAIEAGTATINGLNDATYYLQEDVAPEGYNQLNERKSIAVTEGTAAEGVDISIENNQGAALPSTGGIGTTIFYVLGTLLVVGCGIVLVSRKRMEKNN